MVVGLGLDILRVARMDRALREEGRGWREEIFTPAEIRECERKRHPARHYAARFAAKEAVLKGLAGSSGGWPWRRIEVREVSGAAGGLDVVLRGPLRNRAASLGVNHVRLSLGWKHGLALARAVLVS